MFSFPYLEPVCCSMSISNCCFLTCIQISQEAAQVVWYSHLLKTFPVCCDPHSQRLWNSHWSRSRCFFYDPTDVGNLISSSSAFSKSSLNIWKFLVHGQLKPGLENFEHYFASVFINFLPIMKRMLPFSATGRNIFHRGISSPAFKKKNEESSPPQQQHTSHCLQPIRSHNLELLFFSIELLFKITLTNFLLKSNNSKPPSFVSWTCLWFTIACLNQITVLCYF